eukprot:87242_1
MPRRKTKKHKRLKHVKRTNKQKNPSTRHFLRGNPIRRQSLFDNDISTITADMADTNAATAAGICGNNTTTKDIIIKDAVCCKICHTNTTNNAGLSYHIRARHGMQKLDDYYELNYRDIKAKQKK